ncbi:heparan-alpha-glucosaminide N-acetyltransferase domain-containing protein [Leifsonia sp. NPDC058230]|uniref:heparan-alpha-glucosaminide N-acetyltransferase domain-containing protein n=1 Tax=Leifsonia sp. NPDC058230 TaxID=3346391 RepID=UPI0036DC8CCF
MTDGVMPRLVGLDIARFVAILGMMSAHVTERGESWFFAVSDGNASTLFAVIGGLSIVLATRRYLDAGAAVAACWALAARGVAVIGIGLTLGLLGSPAIVVLVYFGASMICTVPFLFAPTWVLVLSATVLAVVGPLVNGSVRAQLGAPDEGGSLAWTALEHPVTLLRATFVTGTYPVITWLVYMLVGMTVARLLFIAQQKGTHRRFAIVLAGIGAAGLAATLGFVALLFRLLGRESELSSAAVDLGAPGSGWWSYLLHTPHTGSFFDITRGVGVAFIVIGVCLLLAWSLPSVWLVVLHPVSAAGAAPLTVYVAHIFAYSFATAYYQESGAAEFPWWFSGPSALALHAALALVIGAILALLRRRGPLETFVSRFSEQIAEALSPRTPTPAR